MTVEDFDENKSGYRKLRTPKKQKKQEIQAVKIDHAVVTTQEIPLKVLSEKLGISAVEISKRLFKEGIMKSINDSIDYDNAALLAGGHGDRSRIQAGKDGGGYAPRHRGDGRGRGESGAPGARRHGHGSRRPRQDLPSGQNPLHVGHGGGSGRHHAEHRRVHGHGEGASRSPLSTRPATRRSRRCGRAARR